MPSTCRWRTPSAAWTSRRRSARTSPPRSTAAIADTHVHTDFDAKAFRLLASDPLVACCGTDDGPCSRGIEIRVGMHLSTAPDGRAQSWQEDRPVVRCVWCDSRHAGEVVNDVKDIDVLIHLNIVFSAATIQDAENMAWDFARAHGIYEHVVYIEAE